MVNRQLKMEMRKISWQVQRKMKQKETVWRRMVEGEEMREDQKDEEARIWQVKKQANSVLLR